MAGINFISVIIGLFAIAEIMVDVEEEVKAINMTEVRDVFPTWADIKQCIGAMLRSTGIGFFMGLLPGCAPSVTTFVAYDVEKRISKHPERFGKGAIEGVAAPEGANNATSSAGFVPLFSFGLPTAPSMAVLLGGLMMYGLQPGPMLFKAKPPVCMGCHCQHVHRKRHVSRFKSPAGRHVGPHCHHSISGLGPLIIVVCSLIGTYSIRFLAFDVWVMSSSSE